MTLVLEQPKGDSRSKAAFFRAVREQTAALLGSGVPLEQKTGPGGRGRVVILETADVTRDEARSVADAAGADLKGGAPRGGTSTPWGIIIGGSLFAGALIILTAAQAQFVREPRPA